MSETPENDRQVVLTLKTWADAEVISEEKEDK